MSELSKRPSAPPSQTIDALRRLTGTKAISEAEKGITYRVSGGTSDTSWLSLETWVLLRDKVSPEGVYVPAGIYSALTIARAVPLSATFMPSDHSDYSDYCRADYEAHDWLARKFEQLRLPSDVDGTERAFGELVAQFYASGEGDN